MSRLVVLAVVLCARVGAADPELPAPPWPSDMEAGIYVGGFISNYFHQFYDSSRMTTRPALDTVAPQFGARYAYFPGRFFGVEGEGAVALESTQDTGDSVAIYRLGVQALFQLPARVTPFVGVGGGMWHSVSDSLGTATHFPVHVGIGARFFATPTIVLRADLRLYRGPSDQRPYTFDASYGEFSVGLSWIPGAAAAAPAPVKIDLDPDRDGILGDADKCPNEYSTNPDGCPTRDSDGDGIPDDKDKCIDQPETINGYQDEDGCPDSIPDSDGDGINDVLDKCPREPGPADTGGCPVLRLPDPVRFTAATATLAVEAHGQLDELARAMLAHAEIAKVRIEATSQDRAQAIVDYLVQQGKVPPARLEASGQPPVASRDASERVVVHVVAP